MKLCLSPPQDKITTVRFPVNSSVHVASNLNLIGFRPCSGLAGLVAAMLSGSQDEAMELHYLVLHVGWKSPLAE